MHLTDTELRVICNCINESCNGISLAEFETRIGTKKKEVEGMLDKLLAVLSK
jgi:hypothetical protein